MQKMLAERLVGWLASPLPVLYGLPRNDVLEHVTLLISKCCDFGKKHEGFALDPDDTEEGVWNRPPNPHKLCTDGQD